MHIIDDGGQAFPGQGMEPGMTLRDYYKGQALVHLLHDDTMFTRFGKGISGDLGETADDIADFCGAMADAMIAENNV